MKMHGFKFLVGAAASIGFAANFAVLAEDKPALISYDSSGNAYVTASYTNSGGTVDYATLKYDTSGQQAWVNYMNSGLSYGNASMAVDTTTGDVYVTAPVKGNNPKKDYDTDFQIVKYDSVGIEKWKKQYNGPAKSSDWPTGIVVGESGNVYVTGDTCVKENEKKGTYEYDFTTLKYDSSGKQKWKKRYAGPSKSKQKSNRPTCIICDSAGFIYVAGDSQSVPPKGSSVQGYDFATVKYDTKGKQHWARRYNGSTDQYSGFNIPAGIAVDISGNAYVTGNYYPEGGGNTTLQTIMYAYSSVKKEDGKQAWVQKLDIGSSGNAVGVVVDASGNLYVAGTENGSNYILTKYGSQGGQQWTRRYPESGGAYSQASAIAVDSSGNIYVTGSSGNEFTTLKYTPDGNYIPLGQGSDPIPGFPVDIAVSPNGYIYLTGRSGNGFATAQYGSDGTLKRVGIFTPSSSAPPASE